MDGHTRNCAPSRYTAAVARWHLAAVCEWEAAHQAVCVAQLQTSARMGASASRRGFDCAGVHAAGVVHGVIPGASVRVRVGQNLGASREAPMCAPPLPPSPPPPRAHPAGRRSKRTSPSALPLAGSVPVDGASGTGAARDGHGGAGRVAEGTGC